MAKKNSEKKGAFVCRRLSFPGVVSCDPYSQNGDASRRPATVRGSDLSYFTRLDACCFRKSGILRSLIRDEPSLFCTKPMESEPVKSSISLTTSAANPAPVEVKRSVADPVLTRVSPRPPITPPSVLTPLAAICRDRRATLNLGVPSGLVFLQEVLAEGFFANL